MGDALVNKIAASGLITLRPEDWVPTTPPVPFDLKDFLFMGQIVKEKDFREAMKQLDWTQYKDKPLTVFCSTDAIIPNWAYMLITSLATPFAREVFSGTPDAWIQNQLMRHINAMDVEPYADQRVIIKGCSDHVSIGPDVYMALTSRLQPIVKSLMFGEPCSTVPVYKRPKQV